MEFDIHLAHQHYNDGQPIFKNCDIMTYLTVAAAFTARGCVISNSETVPIAVWGRLE